MTDYIFIPPPVKTQIMDLIDNEVDDYTSIYISGTAGQDEIYVLKDFKEIFYN